MTVKRLFAIAAIFLCTSFCWAVLGASLVARTMGFSESLGQAVSEVWGPAFVQLHPLIFHNMPGNYTDADVVPPSESSVTVSLQSEPKKKGLLLYRTFLVDFRGDYTVTNAAAANRTLYIKFQLPAKGATYSDVSVLIDGKELPSSESRTGDSLVEAVSLDPGQSVKVTFAYKSRGTDTWTYSFGDTTRIRNFNLAMSTDFPQIDFPAGTGSPTKRATAQSGWNLTWSYPDVINARAIGMNMPALLNPGPVASRIAFFSPVSLLFFFTVLLLLCLLQGVDLHPMNYFFLAAGCFAFQLLFAYLVDLIPLLPAFAAAASVSLVLISGYLLAAAGWRLARIAALAQFGYMVLFSYSFFFDGLTGLTITIGAIVTLALLMAATARVNWSEKFTRSSSRIPSPAV